MYSLALLTCQQRFVPRPAARIVVNAILQSERSVAGSKHVIIGGDADLFVIAATLTGGILGEIGVYTEDHPIRNQQEPGYARSLPPATCSDSAAARIGA